MVAGCPVWLEIYQPQIDYAERHLFYPLGTFSITFFALPDVRSQPAAGLTGRLDPQKLPRIHEGMSTFSRHDSGELQSGVSRV